MKHAIKCKCQSVYTKQPQKKTIFIYKNKTNNLFFSHTQKEYLIQLACYKDERRSNKRKYEKNLSRSVMK